MKKIQCELCGGKNIVKENEFFICQDCGAKYTLEQAKKMLSNEETDSHNNQTSGEDNLRNMARRALESKDYEHIEKYYEELCKSNSNDWEAVFYKLYGNAMNITFRQLDKKIILLQNSLDGLERVVSSYTDKIERVRSVMAIGLGIVEICTKFRSIAFDMYYNCLEKRDYYRDGITDPDLVSKYNQIDYTKRLDEIGKICLVWGEIQIPLLEDFLDDKQKKEWNTLVLDAGISAFLKSFIYKEILDIRQIDSDLQKRLNYYCSLIQKHNPSYKNPIISQDEFNHRRAKIQKDDHGENFDPIVFDVMSNRQIHYSQWTKKKTSMGATTQTPTKKSGSTQQATPQQATPQQEQQPQEENSINWPLAILGGIILGLIYISCTGC